MCRNIKTLFNFDPPATTGEVQASSLQFVRKLSGFNKPSIANEEAFYLAVERVSAAAEEMLNTLVTNALPCDREIEAARCKGKSGNKIWSSLAKTINTKKNLWLSVLICGYIFSVPDECSVG